MSSRLSIPDLLGMGALALGILLIAAAFINALYVYVRHQRSLDQAVMKSDYYDGGFLMAFNRLMMYGYYCLFPKRAIRDGVNDVFQNLTPSLRRHLAFHWIAIIGSFTLFAGSYAIAEVFGLFD